MKCARVARFMRLSTRPLRRPFSTRPHIYSCQMFSLSPVGATQSAPVNPTDLFE
jgi:hypothetical protein